MLIGDDDQAARIVAVLAAAIIRNRQTTDPNEAAEIFQEMARKLSDRGMVCAMVARRTVLP